MACRTRIVDATSRSRLFPLSSCSLNSWLTVSLGEAETYMLVFHRLSGEGSTYTRSSLSVPVAVSFFCFPMPSEAKDRKRNERERERDEGLSVGLTIAILPVSGGNNGTSRMKGSQTD